MKFVRYVFFVIILVLIKVGDFVVLMITNLRHGIFLFKQKVTKSFKNLIVGKISIRKTKVLWEARKGKNKKFWNIKKRKKKKVLHKSPFFAKLGSFLIGIIFSFFFLFLPLLFIIFISDLPNPVSLSANFIPKTTKIYDRKGALLYEIYATQNRTVVKLQDIPKYLRVATIAIEDKDFYNHLGFDLRGIVRAVVKNVRYGELQGGSTITQQLIRSAFLTSNPSVVRKAKEIVLAVWSERIYTKDQILEMYFNYIPYGGTAWGVEAASQVYFGKKVGELTLAESAFLAGMPKAPTLYSPFNGNRGLFKKRQKEVLDAMMGKGYITRLERDEAYKMELSFRSPQVPIKAPHFVLFVKDSLLKRYGLGMIERGGLKVTTSIDLPLQEEAEKIVQEEVEGNAYLNVQNGATLVTNPANGDILAMVGSRDYFDTEHDGNVNVTTALRQPGSSIKVVTYSLALSRGFTEASILDDSPLKVTDSWGHSYSPVNYDGKFHGRLPLRLALANSLNVPAVRVAQKLGVEAIVDFGKKMGIKSWDSSRKYGLSITLGGADVTMMDLATAYGTIANEGERVNLDPIVEVSDSEGNVIYKKNPVGKRVVDKGVAFIISDILADNKARSMEFGLNSPLSIPGRRVSVKTGTSDNKRDNWTAGFNNKYLVVAWVGNNDNSPMSQNLASGITGAAPIWNRVTLKLLEGEKDPPLVIPENVTKKFCFGYNTLFIKGTESRVNCKGFPTPSPSPNLQ